MGNLGEGVVPEEGPGGQADGTLPGVQSNGYLSTGVDLFQHFNNWLDVLARIPANHPPNFQIQVTISAASLHTFY